MFWNDGGFTGTSDGRDGACRSLPYRAIYPDHAWGGLERVVGNLANEFARRGHQVDLVLAEAVGDFLKALDPRVRVVPLNAPKLRAYTLALASYLRRNRPAALLSASDECNLAAVWARALVRVPTRLVISCHSTLSRYVPVATDRKVRLLPLLIRRTYAHADAVVAVSGGSQMIWLWFRGFRVKRLRSFITPP